MSSQVVLARRQGDCAVLCGSRREETTSNAPQMCRNIGDAAVRSHQRPAPGSEPRRPWDTVELLDEGVTMQMSHR